MTIHRIKEILENPTTNMAQWLHDDTDYIEELIYVSPHEVFYNVYAKIAIVPDTLYSGTLITVDTQSNTISTRDESVDYWQDKEELRELITTLYKHRFTSPQRNPQDDRCPRYRDKPETVVEPELIHETEEPPTRTIEELLDE